MACNFYNCFPRVWCMLIYLHINTCACLFLCEAFLARPTCKKPWLHHCHFLQVKPHLQFYNGLKTGAIERRLRCKEEKIR